MKAASLEDSSGHGEFPYLKLVPGSPGRTDLMLNKSGSVI